MYFSSKVCKFYCKLKCPISDTFPGKPNTRAFERRLGQNLYKPLEASHSSLLLYLAVASLYSGDT
jgi:hypothetical protein